MRYYENIERIFNDEVRDKKRTGRGVFSMRGKGVKHGFSGALKTPYHYMSNKEKKKLNGEVEVFNMFETILSWTEFQKKDENTQRKLLEKWREVYPNATIMEQLSEGRKSKFHSQSFADLVNDLGCEKKHRGGSKPRTGKSKAKPQPEAKTSQNENTGLLNTYTQNELALTPEKKEKIETEVRQMIITRGLHLEYNGAYDVDALNRLFTKLSLLVDGETCRYNINLSLTEIDEKNKH